MGKLTEKLKTFEQEIQIKLEELIEKKGVESNVVAEKVLKIENDDLMYNIEGSGTYIVEISLSALVSKTGYSYSHEGITLEQLCDIVDSFADQEENEEITNVELESKEIIGILQLINDSINSRECDENELGYMGLLNLRNKLHK